MCSHDDFWFEDGDFDFFVGENLGAVDVQLVADVDILAEHAHVLHADPGADGGMPPVNARPPLCQRGSRAARRGFEPSVWALTAAMSIQQYEHLSSV